MAKDVFISYSSVDNTAGETVCSILEQNGISCWIAPRDITPGLDFAEAIIDGIKSSKLFILVYTASSNNSRQVIREVDRAVHTGIPVINLKLEEVPMSKQLEYYLSSVHWLDARIPPLEQHITRLSKVVKMLLSKDEVREDDLKKAISDGTLRMGHEEKSIAVLPFINDSPDQENTYFINGVMEEILNNLQKIKDLRVISRTSAEKYRGQNKSISEIADELGVNYIVEGSGQKYGSSLRLRAQLIMAAKETHLWGESFQQKITDVEDVFNIQIKIAESIAAELKAVISPEEKKLMEKIPIADFEVYDEYLKARSYFTDFSREALDKALEFLNRGVAKNPDWAPLYAGLTEVWMVLQQFAYEPPAVAGPKVMENLNKVLELDPDIPEAHYFNAMIAHLVEWDWEKSEKEFLKALALNPNDSLSRIFYSQLLAATLHRYDEGLAQGELAFSLDPLNPNMKCWYAATLMAAGDFKRGLSVAEEAASTDPGHLMAYSAIIMAAYRFKDYDKVIESESYLLPSILTEENTFKEFESIYSDSGIVKAYEYLLERLEKFAENNYVSFLDMTFRYLIVNLPDKALDWVERGIEMHDPQMVYISSTLYFLDPLFGNPRFIAICGKMKLPIPKPL